MKKLIATIAASLFVAAAAHAVIYTKTFDVTGQVKDGGVTNTVNLYGELLSIDLAQAALGHTGTLSIVHNGRTVFSKTAAISTLTTNYMPRAQVCNTAGTPLSYTWSPGVVAEATTNTVPVLEPFPLGGQTTVTITGGSLETTTNSWTIKLLLRQ